MHTLQPIFSPAAPAPIGPYSQAIVYNGIAYLSGTIALDAHTGEMEQRSIEAETEKVFSNLQAVLEAAGCSFKSVLKVSIFLMDMGDFATVNQIYSKYFLETYPARETVQVSALPKGARIEISLIAAVEA